MIWTTTPWTLPANQALNLNPELEYALVDTERGLLLAGERAGREVPGSATGSRARSSPPRRARRSRASSFHHPLAACTRSTTALAPVYLADYVTAEDGTGIVHSSPGLRRRGLQLLPRARPGGTTTILNPVQGNGVYDADAAALRRPAHLEGEPADRRGAARRRRACSPRATARPQLPALLAPQDAGDLPRHGAVVRRAWTKRDAACSPATRRPKTLRETALRSHRGDRVLSRERQGAPARHDRATGPTGASAASATGACRCRSSCTRRPASCIRARWSCIDRAAEHRRAGRHRGLVRLDADEVLGAEARALRQEQRHPRRLVRLRLDLFHVLRGSASGHDGPTTTAGPRPTSTSKATTSTAAGSTRRC